MRRIEFPKWKGNQRKIPVFLCLCLCLTFLSVKKADAAEYGEEVTLTVSQIFDIENNTSSDVDQNCRYELEGLTAESIVPEGEEAFVLAGSQSHTIRFRFVHGGLFEYRLRAVNDKKENYSYDTSVYTIEIYVLNKESGGLDFQVIVKNEAGEKCGELEFTHRYKASKKPVGLSNTKPESENPGSYTSVKTGDESRVGFYFSFMAAAMIIILFCVKKTQF
ncbi:MAG: hypothetical protein ACI4DZ_16005 [Oliverpabstia sp.]